MLHKISARAIAFTVAAMVMVATPGAAFAVDNPKPKNPTDCPVENVDDKGNVTVTYVPEGSTFGLFHCTGGNWEFGWFPFDSATRATTDSITVDSRGAVTIDEAALDGRAGDVTAQEVKYILEAAGAPKPFVPDQATVFSPEGKPLYVDSALTPDTSIATLAKEAGTEAPTVEFAAKRIKIKITFRCKIWPPYCVIIIKW
ncbi:hypothetical protein [Phytohabitans suffuscus]|uniref:Uncharacterized protein n=1 Tax=Phytohabitans suffuscus TaxID=624315 RepID=A0A6F8YE05_9ACTN|nr:hypothetical protein [Phytohabitans suffuscus]BCB84208.1 hypothetical protein Psuf_015210 [Phytohabitans suffuscus]